MLYIIIFIHDSTFEFYIIYTLYVNKLATVQEAMAIHIPYRTFPASYIIHLNALHWGVIDSNGDTNIPYHVLGVQ